MRKPHAKSGKTKTKTKLMLEPAFDEEPSDKKEVAS
jgi:hypothetical protein